MDLTERLQRVSVIGAAGKMGSGISLLLCHQMMLEKLKNPSQSYILNLIDTREKALEELLSYLRSQLVKMAEKQIVFIRSLYQDRKDLVENAEMIEDFVTSALAIARPSTEMGLAATSHLIFEAIVEEEQVKGVIFKQLEEKCSPQTFFFSNTSSIPIHTLEEKAALQGRILGYHFYNPPAVQRLLEVIPSQNTSPELIQIGEELAKRLRKKVVYSHDVAGFIGNGHFIRDGLFALQLTEKLQQQGHSLAQALYIVNHISQDYLLRPMGIFQLMDYVGIDVFNKIQKIMDKYLPEENFAHPIIDKMVAQGVLGGQRGDGSQKDGFCKYTSRGSITAMYNPDKESYELEEQAFSQLKKELGEMPAGWYPWKKLLKDPNKDEKIATFLSNLQQDNSTAGELAKEYLRRSKEIALGLVSSGVAKSNQDVDEVLLTGFFHLYGITTVDF